MKSNVPNGVYAIWNANMFQICTAREYIKY